MRSAAQEVKADLEFAIKPNTKNKIHHWVLYAAIPPTLERQTDLKASLKIDDCKTPVRTVSEQSLLKRPVFKLSLDSRKQAHPALSGRLELAAILNRCSLRAGKGGAKQEAITISRTDKLTNLASTFSLDYKADSFQNFLKKNSFKIKTGESDLCFAYRVFTELRSLYRYNWAQDLDRKVSKTCLVQSSDCAGLSYLFCAVLRANGIPARTLIGRIARSTRRVEDFSSSFSCHARTEFFVEKIGWIPADLSEAVSIRRSPVENFFGTDHGDLIVMHVNPDLLLDSHFDGMKTIRSMPDFRFWIAGSDGKALDNAAPRQIIWTVDHKLVRH